MCSHVHIYIYRDLPFTPHQSLALYVICCSFYFISHFLLCAMYLPFECLLLFQRLNLLVLFYFKLPCCKSKNKDINCHSNAFKTEWMTLKYSAGLQFITAPQLSWINTSLNPVMDTCFDIEEENNKCQNEGFYHDLFL